MDRNKFLALKSYKEYLDRAGEAMPKISFKCQNGINEAKDFRYILGILVGAELVKAHLINLIILDEYINQLGSVVETNDSCKVFGISEEKYSRKTLGQIKNTFYEKYKIAEKSKLREELDELNEKRNGIAHDMIFMYRGDLKKANEEIRGYVVTQIIQTLVHDLVKIFNEKREENISLHEEIKRLNLV